MDRGSVREVSEEDKITNLHENICSLVHTIKRSVYQAPQAFILNEETRQYRTIEAREKSSLKDLIKLWTIYTTLGGATKTAMCLPLSFIERL